MGNAIAPCCTSKLKFSVKLVFWEGDVKIIAGKRLAGELMFEYPDRIFCPSNSFFIGQSIPSLSIDDELKNGETYFVLPIDKFACKTLSLKLLASMFSTTKQLASGSGNNPFEFTKGADGRLLIKVLPEYLTKVLAKIDDQNLTSNYNALCNTPELQKQYEQLVGSKEQQWSPKLQTISENKNRNNRLPYYRLSPYRLFGHH